MCKRQVQKRFKAKWLHHNQSIATQLIVFPCVRGCLTCSCTEESNGLTSKKIMSSLLALNDGTRVTCSHHKTLCLTETLK